MRKPSIINTSYQKLPFGSGDDPDKLFFYQALNYVSNSSDMELRRAVSVGILLRDVGCHGCVRRRGLYDLDLVVLKCQGRCVRRQFCRANVPRKDLLSLAFLPPGNGKGTPESGDGQSE